MQPVSSRVSNIPSTVALPVWTATGCPSPAARCSQSLRISPKPAAMVPDAAEFHPAVRQRARTIPRRRYGRPSAASEVAGVGVPSGAATTLVPIPTTTASRPSATASASSRMPASFCGPASTSFGHFSENFMWSDPADLSEASMLTFCSAASSASPAAKPRVAATDGRYVDGLKDAAGEIAARRDPGAMPSSAPRGLLRGHQPQRSALASARARQGFRVGRADTDRRRRAGSPPIWLVDRAKMPSERNPSCLSVVRKSGNKSRPSRRAGQGRGVRSGRAAARFTVRS